MSIKETIARTKYCPILSLFLKAPTNCLGKNCMFWTETEYNERGSCDIKEYFRSSLKIAGLVYELYRKKQEETK